MGAETRHLRRQRLLLVVHLLDKPKRQSKVTRTTSDGHSCQAFQLSARLAHEQECTGTKGTLLLSPEVPGCKVYAIRVEETKTVRKGKNRWPFFGTPVLRITHGRVEIPEGS